MSVFRAKKKISWWFQAAHCRLNRARRTPGHRLKPTSVRAQFARVDDCSVLNAF